MHSTAMIAGVPFYTFIPRTGVGGGGGGSAVA